MAALLLIPLLAACGFNMQTDQVYQAATGIDDRSGQVDVLNALVVSAEDGQGTFAGTLVNNSLTEPDKLVSVTGATLRKPIEVAPGGLVNLARTGHVRIDDQSIKPGSMVRVTLQFASGQTTTMLVPIVGPADPYAEVPVGPTATPSPTTSATTSPTAGTSEGSPSGEASPSATPTASE